MRTVLGTERALLHPGRPSVQVRSTGEPLEGRDTCERLGGFHFVLGATSASWSRDNCESLSGFHLVLDTNNGPPEAETLVKA